MPKIGEDFSAFSPGKETCRVLLLIVIFPVFIKKIIEEIFVELFFQKNEG